MNNPSGARTIARLRLHVRDWRIVAAIACVVAGALAPMETGAQQPSHAQATAAARPTSVLPSWPHTVATERGTAIIYQPQVIAWPDRRTLETRIALAIRSSDSPRQEYGTIDVSFSTDSDLATRTVTLFAPKLTSVHFASARALRERMLETRIRAALDRMGDRKVPLDMLLISLGSQAATPMAQAAVKNDPPAIFCSTRPASLLVFDGEPVLAPIAGTQLSAAVNTNWDVFFDASGNTWYWLDNGAWLAAPAFRGPWVPAGALPATFSSLPADANFSAVRKAIPGRPITPATMPTVFVSTLPAEIIVTDGAPRMVAIAGTSLKSVANSDARLFQDAKTGLYYYLVSGRWFSAARLDGPWTFATPDLSSDFARLPADGPYGSVLVSVPGTAQAREAVLQAQVPTQATLTRGTAKIDVVYAGTPKFEPISGTSVAYAVNTNFDVIRVGDRYYVCQHGAWFVAPSPTGAFVLADSVPEVIYAIPPSSPVYRVTCVRVYGATPTSVVYGYTAGYTMAYVSSGVVVYGTGYYYPPVIWPGPVPIYYPYPYSYAGSVWYNPATGAWARGGTVVGPYGGVARGGTAYNPQTGAWAQGGAVYGPNGGAGAWSAYNPSTGGYMHGSASWGTNSGTANANWYNGRTGISGSTNQNYNQYGSWGSSTFSGANKTVTTQHQSDDRGSAGSFSSSTGAKGAGVKGAGGNNAGIAKGANGNVYAGADGNVYRHTSDGWSKWDDGSWNAVQKPAASNEGSVRNASAQSGQSNTSARSGQSGNLSGETERGQGLRSRTSSQSAGSDSLQQLDRDRYARTSGSERQARFSGQQSRGGGGRARR